MNRNEIVRQYEQVKTFNTIFFKTPDLLIKFFLKVILVPLSLFLGVGLIFLLPHEIVESVGFAFFVLIVPGLGVSYILSMTKYPKWVNNLQIFSRFSDRVFQNHEKKWGMTKKEIEDYISHRTQLGDDDSISYLLPCINQLCQLNEEAKEEQKTFLSGFLNEKELKLVFDKEYSDAQIESAYQYWRGKELGKKKTLMELLFKLTVEQDGIHNDEWKLLIQIMTQLKFNNRYIEYFKNRYSPLRTEFDDYERKSTSTLGEYSVARLKPYYAVLGLKEEASIEEIKQAYHNLVLQHHPDLPKNADRIEECEEMMMKINDAYEKLQR
ncbi:MAG: J domain-containing protein [Paludibacteraceae bacterium]|nr:J domain-containing protein [Paludibacteraceae bacterium]